MFCSPATCCSGPQPGLNASPQAPSWVPLPQTWCSAENADGGTLQSMTLVHGWGVVMDGPLIPPATVHPPKIGGPPCDWCCGAPPPHVSHISVDIPKAWSPVGTMLCPLYRPPEAVIPPNSMNWSCLLGPLPRILPLYPNCMSLLTSWAPRAASQGDPCWHPPASFEPKWLLERSHEMREKEI